jgi:hypothetical protein
MMLDLFPVFYWETLTMGIDLQVMASHFREHRGEMLATATLRFDRDARLLGQLDRGTSPCLVEPLPQGLKVGIYEERGLTYTDVDRYGHPLTFTTPMNLRRFRIPEEIEPWNRAILAFLLALPADARIVLYWC